MDLQSVAMGVLCGHARWAGAPGLGAGGANDCALERMGLDFRVFAGVDRNGVGCVVVDSDCAGLAVSFCT